MPTLADRPDLVAELDAKNDPLALDTIAVTSRRKLWWRCPAGPDHVWAASVWNRAVKGTRCPFCASRAVSVTNALSKVAPAIARQWHPTKNGALRPCDVVAGSHRSVWWKCPRGPDHEWTGKIELRVNGQGCPFCSGRRATAAHNLAVAFPELALAWHPTRNGALRPQDVRPHSHRPVWWKCRRRHAWSAPPDQRADGDGCPFCSGHRVAPERSLAALAPALARQWDREKNGGLTPRDVTMASRRRVFWKCPKGPDHRWQAPVAARGHRGRGCPFCAGQRVSVTNALAARFPRLAREWHPAKNGGLTPHDVTRGTPRRVWWRCASAHEWQAGIAARAGNRPDETSARKARDHAGTGCPFCSNHRVCETNSLAARFPKLAREWHPAKNGSLGPHDIVAGAHRRAWWRCAFGHAWRTAVSARTSQGSGCPECWRLGRTRKVATTGRRQRSVRLARYEGPRYGPVRRVR